MNNTKRTIVAKLTRKQKKALKRSRKENIPPVVNTKAQIASHIAALNKLLSVSRSTRMSSKPQPKPSLKQKLKAEVKKLAVKEGKKILRNNAEKIGLAIGAGATAIAGPAAGASVGLMAEQGAIKIAGNGDYVVTANSLFNKGGSVDVVPKFGNSKRGTRVVHCEYLGDVISSATANTFENTSYVVNPGNPTTFPWLNSIAANYDQWRPNGIVFAFKSTSSSYSGTTQALGGVVLATDYDLVDPAYASKIEMENTAFANSCKSDVNILHPIECAIRERPVALLKCRGPQTPVDNLQWYDLANFQVATFGVAGTSVNLGELWVTYDITFFKEQVYGGLRGGTVGLYACSATTGITTSAYFGSNATLDADNTFGVELTGTTITFPESMPVGSYLVYYRVTGDSGANVPPTVSGNGCSIIDSVSVGASFTGTSTIYQRAIKITSPGALLTFASATLPANPVSMLLRILQVNPGIVN